jgi:hypothetical protein
MKKGEKNLSQGSYLDMHSESLVKDIIKGKLPTSIRFTVLHTVAPLEMALSLSE